MRRTLLLLTAVCALMLSCRKQNNLRPEEDSSNFVNITDVIPGVILEIRYHSTYNFVGARIDGYEQPVALLTREAADSLKAVNSDALAGSLRALGGERCRYLHEAVFLPHAG